MFTFKLVRLTKIGHDEASGMVVRARTHQRARELASMSAKDEGPAVWIDMRYSACWVTDYDPEGVVLIHTLDG